MYFETVRQNLLSEAKASPNLLSDLAGLENYIAESYHNRSFIELLQNADDAKSSKFKIIKNNDLLFVANNGREFNQTDLESLCRSASSNKLRGDSIGYRGIGFKSVVSFTKEIHILSGNLELTFSKELTQSEIPSASRVPLIRIPHNLTKNVKEEISSVLTILKNEGFSTIFVFTGITANEIEAEFNSFEYNSLLFLRNIIETEITLKEKISTKISKTKISDSETKISFNTNGNITNWLISNNEYSSIAFSFGENEIIKLSNDEAIVHSFLPTEDKNGLGILINGNFSTDPSRRHLIFDELTADAIELCCTHIIKLLETYLKKENENFHLIKSLIPYSDPRMLQFARNSFEKKLLESLKNLESNFFKNIRLCPSWINPNDFNNVADQNLNIVNKRFYEIDGFIAFAKYMGSSEINFSEIKENINKSELSVLGCIQLAQYIFKNILSNKSEIDFIDLNIFHSNGKRKSLKEINSESLLLDDSYISLLIENGITELDIKQILKKFSPNTIVEKQFFKNDVQHPELEANPQNTVIDWFNKSNEFTNEQIKTSIKRWRNAEEQTLEILNSNGFKLEDVSKQNIGYDLGGFDPNGNQIQIEVKSIALPGQKFKLTNNEIAVAQEKQKSFYIAVVRQNEDVFEIALISDPVNNLTLNRQCVQWIWECENYEYKPMRFSI